MKAVLIASMFTMISAPVAADDWKEKCSQISELSKTIMKARQVGVSMADSMGTASNKLGEAIIIAAYDKPRYSTPKVQQQTIEDFSNEWYLQCVKELRK